MKNKVIILFLALTAISFNAGCKEVNIDGVHRKSIHRKTKGMPIININIRAIKEAMRWCRTSGGLKTIQLDPNKNYLYIYICRYPKHTIDAGYPNH